MNEIISTANPKIKSIKKLFKKSEREINKKFIAEGLRTCSTLIESGIELEECFLTNKHKNLTENIFKNLKTTIVPENVIKFLSQAKTPCGILCIFKIPNEPKPEELESGIVCVNISDPGNLGTLIRTSSAFGKSSVVLIDGADLWSHKAVQATAGTIGFVKIFRWSWEKLISNKNTLKLCALVPTDGKPLTKANLCNSLIVVGNESHGIPEEYIQTCDTKITIPMPGKTESLNASIAGAISLFVSIN